MRLLNRQRIALELSDPVMLAGEREAAAGEKTLDDLQAFFHTLDADTWAVVRDSRLLVVQGQPARPKAEIEPAVRKQVERRDLFGQHHRMAVIVVEYQGADSQGGRGVGRRHQCRDRGKLLAEVVRKVEELITERLHKPRSVPPCLAAGCGVFLHPKPERLGRVFHDCASSQPAASALSMISAGCAPETPYRRLMTKNGTPVMPSSMASRSSARTSSANAPESNASPALSLSMPISPASSTNVSRSPISRPSMK